MDLSSALLSFLAGASVRSLVLAVLPLALLLALRVKSAATRHAVLFLLTAGMLALAARTCPRPTTARLPIAWPVPPAGPPTSS